jgi:hypothetical protein
MARAHGAVRVRALAGRCGAAALHAPAPVALRFWSLRGLNPKASPHNRTLESKSQVKSMDWGLKRRICACVQASRVYILRERSDVVH